MSNTRHPAHGIPSHTRHPFPYAAALRGSPPNLHTCYLWHCAKRVARTYSFTECTNVAGEKAGEKLAIGGLQTIGGRTQRINHDFSYTRHIRSERSYFSENSMWAYLNILKTNTVWFFSTATKNEDIKQKLEKLAKFWKKPLEDESLQFFAERFQGFSGKNMIFLILVPLLMKFRKVKN